MKIEDRRGESLSETTISVDAEELIDLLQGLADLVEVCAGSYQATASRFAFFRSETDVQLLPETDEFTASYARFTVPDKAGVLAGIATILSNHGVSLRSIHQGEPAVDGSAIIEAITHPLRGGSFLAAVDIIDRSGLTVRPTVILRRL